MATSANFESAYKQLNAAQKKVVDTIDGPVMVIAGPGTGKTQVLAIRIANILQKTDTPAGGILCLTFTNSGVRAMQQRLRTYIGSSASRVVINTFHSFGMNLLEEFYTYLDFAAPPILIDDIQSVALCDEILHQGNWKHIRSRANPALYFNDIKSLVSLLKRERITPDAFLIEIVNEIHQIEQNPDNISSRGATKGQLKQDAQKNIESLERTKELVTFYETYETLKKERGLLDYDDVLESIVRLVETSDDVRDTIRERYLYVLVDEHQDSSGVQNEFLARVWGGIEKPNVFVVGDDRQLIYGFGGASLSYFEGFKTMFGGVQLFTLTDNYRSTQSILDSAEELLKSSLADAKLAGKKGGEKIQLVECDYPRDEIIMAGLAIKQKIAAGIDANDCAILVPKNAQVKNAVRVLQDMGLEVSANNGTKLFALSETQSLLQVLHAINDSANSTYLVGTLLDPLSGINPIEAHEYLAGIRASTITLAKLGDVKEKSISAWAKKLHTWVSLMMQTDVYGLIQRIGDELLLQTATDHEALIKRVEIVRTMLHLVLSSQEKSASNRTLTLSEFLAFIARLESYASDVNLAVFAADKGVKVMTLHASKGLEFDVVWIAHADERSLAGKHASAFTLPQSIKTRVEEKDELTTKRQLYVAITRAKRFCSISYARHNHTGADQTLASIISDLPTDTFETKTLSDSESIIKEHDITAYVTSKPAGKNEDMLGELVELVKDQYVKRNVSVSALNNFFECPWKWYFRNMLCLPEIETPSLIFGNIVHSAIEDMLKHNTVPSIETLRSIINARTEKIIGINDAALAQMANEALDILSRWSETRLADIAPERQSEFPFYNFHDPEFEHLKITGKIDLLEKIDDATARVTDFKTGKARTKNEIEKIDDEGRMSDYLRQLAMYSYLLSGKSNDTISVNESRLEFIEAEPESKNALYATHITDEQIQMLKDDIRTFDHMLKEGTWINRPCNFKPYGKTDAECDYCRLSKIYTKEHRK